MALNNIDVTYEKDHITRSLEPRFHPHSDIVRCHLSLYTKVLQELFPQANKMYWYTVLPFRIEWQLFRMQYEENGDYYCGPAKGIKQLLTSNLAFWR